MTRAIITTKLTDRDYMSFNELNLIAVNHEFMTELANREVLSLFYAFLIDY